MLNVMRIFFLVTNAYEVAKEYQAMQLKELISENSHAICHSICRQRKCVDKLSPYSMDKN